MYRGIFSTGLHLKSSRQVTEKRHRCHILKKIRRRRRLNSYENKFRDDLKVASVYTEPLKLGTIWNVPELLE